MKKIYLLLVLTYIMQLKTFAQEASNPLNHGKELLESLKAPNSDKLLAQSMTIVDYVNTTLAKTQNQEVRNKIINELLKEDPKNKKWEKETIKRFDQIKQNNKLDWQNAEFIDFKFKKDDKKSEDLNFIIGSASLFFKSDGKQYEFKIRKFAKLQTGWKGFDYDEHLSEKSDKQSESGSLENFGKALLESLKENESNKLLNLSLSIETYKKTVQAKTPEKFKSNFIAEVAKEDDERIRKRTTEHFNRIKQNKEINWQNAKFVDFKFERENKRSDNLGFDWGPGRLFFNDKDQQYELKVSEMTQLLSGWKGMGFRLNKIEDKTLENYGKALLDAFKESEPNELLKIITTGSDFIKTVSEKTQNQEIKDRILKDMPDIDKMTEWQQKNAKREFEKIIQNEQINWENAEFIDFKYTPNESETKELNFKSGNAVLIFAVDAQNYEIKVREVFQLINGWRSNGFKMVE